MKALLSIACHIIALYKVDRRVLERFQISVRCMLVGMHEEYIFNFVLLF